MILAHRIKVPSIVLLLFGGIILGPEVLGLVDPTQLRGGLEIVVAIAVAIILFEGGLTLDFGGYKRAPTVIRRLLTVGPLVTWTGVSVSVYYFLNVSFEIALMCGSLVIVTGPTVISPLLRRLDVDERIHQVLYWEGVLIDAVGVFVAVLCFEWITFGTGEEVRTLARFGGRVLVGLGVGLLFGVLVAYALKAHLVSNEHTNIFVLGAALLTFGISDSVLPEAGILAVVVAGFVVALMHPPQLKYVKSFKLQLTELGIGLLFILLAAKLELSNFMDPGVFLVLLVTIFLLRPISIWLSTAGQSFKFNEKLFLSWVAPRGIVAASMASLFSMRLQKQGFEGAIYLEIVTFAVIIATVTLQGLTAPTFARLLGLQRFEHAKWVLAGESGFVHALGRALRRGGVPIVELGEIDGSIEHKVNVDDPKFADAYAVFCAHNTMFDNIRAVSTLQAGVHSELWYHWGIDEMGEFAEDSGFSEDDYAGEVAWNRDLNPARVSAGLAEGRYAIEVIDVSNPQRGRFGEALRPLFWIQDSAAILVSDPLNPGRPRGNLAVVLKTPIAGLKGLVEHVDILPETDLVFNDVVRDQVSSAARTHPEISVDEVVEGILLRQRSMSTVLGSGIAIPHAYCNGLTESLCFLAVIPNGIQRKDSDEKPVQLVFVLLSPVGEAASHLEALAAIGRLGQDPAFLQLLTRQKIPDEIVNLIGERA